MFREGRNLPEHTLKNPSSPLCGNNLRQISCMSFRLYYLTLVSLCIMLGIICMFRGKKKNPLFPFCNLLKYHNLTCVIILISTLLLVKTFTSRSLLILPKGIKKHHNIWTEILHCFKKHKFMNDIEDKM